MLLPALSEHQRPNLIVGSSLGAINGAYVAAVLTERHVRASAAIPALFPAVQIEDGPGAGWYFDGGLWDTGPLNRPRRSWDEPSA